MKTKHLGRYIIALFLSLALVIPTGLAALAASTDMNNDASDHLQDASGHDSWWNPSYNELPNDGVRLTAVNATTGEVVSASIDWTVAKPFESYSATILRTFSKVSKTDYKNGVALNIKPINKQDYNKEYHDPPAGFPKILQGDIQEIRNYFIREDTLKSFVAHLYGLNNASDVDSNAEAVTFFNKILSGEYDILVEPIAFFVYKESLYGGTAMEIALLDKQLAQGQQDGPIRKSWVGPISHFDLPAAIFPDRDHPNLGYTGGQPPVDHTSSSGNPYYYSGTIINSALGVGIIYCSPPDTPEIPIHYYKYTYEVDVDPDNPDPPKAELIQKIKDEGIQPKVTATTGSTPSDKNYNPLVDPTLPKGELHGTQAPSPEWVKKEPTLSKEYPCK